jgi:hypothetical protein
MSLVEAGISPEQRARLANKGRLLYAKFCGTEGRGICAESFALYHIWRGEPEIALDLLVFLDAEVEALRISDPQGKRILAENLAGRIRVALATEGDQPPDPALWATILKAKKQSP